MENRYFAVIVVMILAMLFVAGFFFSEQQIDIAGCTAKWKVVSATVERSELCPSDKCVASPDAQQQNAIVDALLCACEKAKSLDYSDDTVNRRIQDVVSNFFGYASSAQEVCGQPGFFLAKRSYE